MCFLVAVLGVNFLLVPMRPGRKSEWESTYDIFLAVSTSFQGAFLRLIFSRMMDMVDLNLLVEIFNLQLQSRIPLAKPGYEKEMELRAV